MSYQERLQRLFGEKHVMEISCRYCSHVLSRRGMKALLLADTKTELFSTDLPPHRGAALAGPEYRTQTCDCRISDVACLCCGNVVGYHVTRPCTACLKACNNGHFWMFHGSAAWAVEREDLSRKSHMVWSNVPCPAEDQSPRKRAMTAVHSIECVR